MNTVEVFLYHREALAAGVGVFLLSIPLMWVVNEALAQAGRMIDERLRRTEK